MKVLVLGGNGFIGSAIVEQLLQANYFVRIFTKAPIIPFRTFFAHELIEWVEGDFANLIDIQKALEGVEAVIHLISTTNLKTSTDNSVFDITSNLIPTIQLLDCMVKLKIKKILFSSSGGSIYGNPEYLPINEAHSTNPIVSYGITKLAIEKFLLLYQRLHQIKVIILRISNPYGERQSVYNSQGVVAVFLNAILKQKTINIWGNGDAQRDYIYIHDVASAFIKALKYQGNQSIFNIASGQAINLNELIKLLEQTCEQTTLKKFYPAREFDVPINLLDNSLARIELYWSPTTSLKLGLKQTIQWYKKIPSD